MRGRNSDNALIEERLGWAPSVSLENGLLQTYRWIFNEMSEAACGRVRSVPDAAGGDAD